MHTEMFNIQLCYEWYWDSSVSIVTRYRLEGPGIETLGGGV
jgi:hypothetical protein